MATWASDELPPCDDDAAEFDDDAIPADGILLQRGGTGPAGESIARETGQAPSLYVVIHNIKSSDNVGQLIRTAGAFGAREVLVVSAERTARRMRKNLRTFGAHGSDKRVPMRAFASLAQLIAWVKSEGCRVVGVEIDAPRSIKSSQTSSRPFWHATRSGVVPSRSRSTAAPLRSRSLAHW